MTEAVYAILQPWAIRNQRASTESAEGVFQKWVGWWPGGGGVSTLR
jgi:hypothetical protein